MAKVPGKKLVLSFIVAAMLATAWAPPAAAARRSFDEAAMAVVTEGLTADQHLDRQAEMSRALLTELPPDAEMQAFRIPFTAADTRVIDKASRRESPLRIGIVKPIEPIVVNGLDAKGAFLGAGGLSRQLDGNLVWAAVIQAEGAGGIRLHVQDLWLPDNAELYVYSKSGQAHGPYTGYGPGFTGEFWTTAVFGSEVILQIRFTGPVSDEELRRVSLRVTDAGLISATFARGLMPQDSLPWLAQEKFCGNQPCIVDATCTNVAAANPAKLAVAKMEWIQGPYIYTCTGGLINDNNPSLNNFFLTANHCLRQNSVAQNVSFYWRFATATCNSTTCPSNTGWPYITTGSTLVSTSSRQDYTLLRLNSNPPAGSVLMGWTSAAVANTNGAQLYRISNPIFGPQVYSQHNVDTGAGTCLGAPRGRFIYSRDITGAIDGGSSGSPVFNGSTQVVGQLSGTCGTNPSAVCDSGPGEANATLDGAFASYYSRIRQYINP